jgi:hypothetical protein
VSRTPDLKLHGLWRDRVRRQNGSGLTVVQFCAQQSLSVASFYAWKRRLRLTDLANHGPGLPAQRTFLPVTVRVLDRGSQQFPPIEADLPNGVRLRIPTADSRLACRLVRVVAGARTDSGGSRC